jgi:hypothetical protein
MSLTRTRIIRLKHKIAAHSITDVSRPIFDAFHFYKLADTMLGSAFAKMVGQMGTELEADYRYSLPMIYYKDMKISEGQDDDIIHGEMLITASDALFPEIEIIMPIENSELKMPNVFNYKGNKFKFSPEGLKIFFKKVNPRFSIGKKEKYPYPTLSGAKVRTVYFGDPSQFMTRDDIGLEPVMTGDEKMMSRATGPYIGV